MNSISSKINFLIEQGYTDLRVLPDGRIIGISKFMYTYGLMVNLNEYGYDERFCYTDYPTAIAAVNTWDGCGDPPYNWVKAKGLVERSNPNFKGINIKEEHV
jgi:hypothetical protein